MKIYETLFQGRQETRRPAAGALLCGALALTAAALVFAPAGAEAQAQPYSYGIYKCTASYTIDYLHTDTRITGVDFAGGRDQRLRARARYFMVVDDGGSVDLIYFDPKTLKWSRIDDCPYDCFQYLNLAKPKQTKISLSVSNRQQLLDIDLDGMPDAERCEILCLTGSASLQGNKVNIKDPGLEGPNIFFSFAPSSLRGTYCRVTCYNTGWDHYVEGNLKKDYSYGGPFQDGSGIPTASYGVACVAGKISCRLDRNLTIDFINVTNNGTLTVENYLTSKGYTFDGAVDWATVDLSPLFTPNQVPFLP